MRGGTDTRDLLRGRIPRPFVVVHSANTTIGRDGYFSSSSDNSTSFVSGGGLTRGYENARRIACRSDKRSTLRVLGYDAVNIGSKTAAR